jgi:hypothetical protein
MFYTRSLKRRQFALDSRRQKKHENPSLFLTITDCIAWPIAFCLHLDGEGEKERGVV